MNCVRLDRGARDKVRRAPGPTSVAADLTTSRAAEALVAHGLDASRPALFVLEGVTMYLGEEVVRDQLVELARSSAAGSRIAADFHPPRDAGAPRDRQLVRLQRLARTGSGEVLRLLVDPGEAAQLVRESGWHVDETVSLREAARDLVPRGSGLPVDAVSAHKTLVAASRP